MSNSGAAHEVGFRVLAHFPPVDFAFSYGSAVIPQVRADGRADTRDGKMMDFIFAVDDPVEWHRNVLTEHPTHYSLLGKLGPHAVSLVQSLGAGVYFNPMVRLTDPSLPLIKYGVVSSKRFRKDLRDWDHLFLAGRLHKPVTVLDPGLNDLFMPTSFDTRARRATASGNNTSTSNTSTSTALAAPTAAVLAGELRSNLRQALSAALLSLPAVFSEEQLWAAITDISYRGDLRTYVAAESADKVLSIARGSRVPFRQLYGPLLAEAGVAALPIADALARGEAAARDAMHEAMVLVAAGRAGDAAARFGRGGGAGSRESGTDSFACPAAATSAEFICVQSVTERSTNALTRALPPAFADAAQAALKVKPHAAAASVSASARDGSDPPLEFARGLPAPATADVEGALRSGVGLGGSLDAGPVLRARAAAAAAVRVECARRVFRSSSAQTVKGIASAGVGKSIKYAAAKLAKGLLGKFRR